MSILVLHADPAERGRIAAGLRERGLEIAEAAEVDEAIDIADRMKVTVVFSDPSILEQEALDIGMRIGVRTGTNPKVVALTHLADPKRKKALAVHEATLLARPVEDLDALAATANELSASSDVVPTAPKKPEPSLGKLKVERLAIPTDEILDAPITWTSHP